MTRSPAWHARIDADGAVGSGFLIADRTVLTCAHVVTGDRASVVFPGAPGLGPVPARVVLRGHTWKGGDRDPGDLAVLELDRPPGLAPAAFAPLDAPYASPTPKLVAYGFPYGYDEEGVQSELRATARQLIRDEWAQLAGWRGYGQETDHGFSGAAVMLEDTGAVAGMVVSHDPVSHTSRMIPARILARYWAPLADLVPTPGYPAEEKRRLRELVARAGFPGSPAPYGSPGPHSSHASPDPHGTSASPALVGALGRLLRAAVGPLGVEPPPGEPGSLWEAVWYLLSEAGRPEPGALPLAELTVRLAGLVGDETLGTELRDWSRAHRARHDPPPVAPHTGSHTAVGIMSHAPRMPYATEHAAQEAAPYAPAPYASAPYTTAPYEAPHASALHAPAPAVSVIPGPAVGMPSVRPSPRRWSPILVEIKRSGADRGALLVGVSAYRDGGRRLVGEERLPEREVRAWVLDRIDDAFAEIDTEGRELIAFALPRAWLNKPVDQWTARKGMSTPLGCVAPVVVMDHDRRSSKRLQFRLKKMWDVLDRQPGSPVHPVSCAGSARPELLTVQLQDVLGPVGLTRPPRSKGDRLHTAVLDAPAPIVLWPRTGCAGGADCGDSCRGTAFLNALADQLSVLPPGDLPERIFELRKRAFGHDGPEPHWAAGLSFVWEDPRWFPDVPPLSRSPVG
ncbi:trypsin-like peptidase domain-containing protein [Streptomyces sp. NPDC093099]|uniref:VMAP-C domain-containing protein n=1 Tax=Streptomyces sp. NPDC093099 TaxID=3366028 RepID=UPI0038247D42